MWNYPRKESINHWLISDMSALIVTKYTQLRYVHDNEITWRFFPHVNVIVWDHCVRINWWIELNWILIANVSWWCHDMAKRSALLVLCEGNPTVTVVSSQVSICLWSGTPWRACYVSVIAIDKHILLTNILSIPYEIAVRSMPQYPNYSKSKWFK